MFGLFYIFVAVFYFAFAKVIYTKISPNYPRISLTWLAGCVLLPCWFFFGFLLSENYREFLSLCEKEAGPYYIKSIETKIPYNRFCSDNFRMLPFSGYEAMDCKYNYRYLRYVFIGQDLDACQTPKRKGEYDYSCFEKTKIVKPDNLIQRETIDERVYSTLTVGNYRKSVISYAIEDGDILAYQKYFKYFPQGNASWLGGSSGSSPSISCEHDRGYVEPEKLFTPIRTVP